MTLIEAIADQGYHVPDHIIWDGELHRFATDADKPYSKDGWYVAHDDAKGKAAAFGSWRNSASHTWSNGTGRALDSAELRAIQNSQIKAKGDIKRARDQAALRASRLYEQALPIEVAPYLTRKGIAANGNNCQFCTHLHTSSYSASIAAVKHGMGAQVTPAPICPTPASL